MGYWDCPVKFPSQHYMTWQSKVAAWVVPLLSEFAIPDDATVQTDVELADLEDATDPFTSSEATFTSDYPGLIPNYRVDPIITPTTGGLDYVIKALKAVGFYGVLTTVVSFDPKKVNLWTFPQVRRNFGFCALSRGSLVSLNQPIHFQQQYHIDEGVLGLISNYDDQFNKENIFNSADKNCLNRFSCYQAPGVRTRVSFLPVFEVWAVKFFQSGG